MKKLFSKTDWTHYAVGTFALVVTMLVVAPITTAIQNGESLVVPMWYSHAAFIGVMLTTWALMMFTVVMFQATYKIVRNAKAAGNPPV